MCRAGWGEEQGILQQEQRGEVLRLSASEGTGKQESLEKTVLGSVRRNVKENFNHTCLRDNLVARAETRSSELT